MISHENPEEVWCDEGCARCKLLKGIDESLTAYLGSLPLKEKPATAVYADIMRLACQRFGLTDREGEVFERMIYGDSNREIAKLLKITEHTVKIHARRVINKMGVERRAQIPYKAISMMRKRTA